MRSVFARLSKPELDFLTDNCNFSDEEIKVFKMASVGKTDIYIADKLSVSDSTVTRAKRSIKKKIKDFIELSSKLCLEKDMTAVCEIISQKLDL